MIALCTHAGTASAKHFGRYTCSPVLPGRYNRCSVRCASENTGNIQPVFDLSEVPASGPHASTNSGGNGTLPEGKWWAGLAIYAATNCGFLKLFDICSRVTDVSKVLMFMSVYYLAAFALRFLLRNVLGIDKKHVPQFFWEPPFYPRRTLD